MSTQRPPLAQRETADRTPARALTDRTLIERAKGLLMTALGLSEQDAVRRLQRTARERNPKLADVAQRVIEQKSLLEPMRPA